MRFTNHPIWVLGTVLESRYTTPRDGPFTHRTFHIFATADESPSSEVDAADG
jgi:hypothetical protein